MTRSVSEIGQDRTVGAVITAAGIDEMLKRVHHGLHFQNSAPQTIDLLQRKALHITTLPRPVAPECQEFLDFLDRKAKVGSTTGGGRIVS